MKYRKNNFVFVYENDEYTTTKHLFKASLGCTRGNIIDGTTYRGPKKSEEGPLDVARYTGKILYKLGRTLYDITFTKALGRWSFRSLIYYILQTKFLVRNLRIKRNIRFGLPSPQKKARK